MPNIHFYIPIKIINFMLSQEELRIALEGVSIKKLKGLLDKHRIYILEPRVTKLDIIDTIILLRDEISDKELMKLIGKKVHKRKKHMTKKKTKRKTKTRKKRSKKSKRKR